MKHMFSVERKLMSNMTGKAGNMSFPLAIKRQESPDDQKNVRN